MRIAFLGLLALCGAYTATARGQSSVPGPPVAPDVPPLMTDRPDFTASPQTVPAVMTQIEAGATFCSSMFARVWVWATTPTAPITSLAAA